MPQRRGADGSHRHARPASHRDLLDGLRSLRNHGAPVVRIYGPPDLSARGGTVAFNVLDAAGCVIPYQAVEDRARAGGVSVRGGCFCNPGASEAAFGYDADTLRRCMTSGFTVERFAQCVGRSTAVGAVRASVGLANNDADIDRLIDVLSSLLP